MPISLPPLSRRRFLKQTFAAGAGVALAPHLLAEATGPDGSVWALLADTHVAEDRNAVARGVKMSESFEKVVRDLAGMKTSSAGAFVLGDLAYSSGEAGDYRTFVELVKPARAAGLPVHLALGNHDHRERFWEVLQEEKESHTAVAERQVALIESAHVNWYLLDSLEKTLSTPGLLGATQLQWLALSLDQHPSKPAVVLVHHNPGERDNITGIKDTQELLNILRPRRQVKAMFFGHTHHWNIARDESGLHLVNLPPVAYVFQRGRPSGWVKATVDAAGILLELRCNDATHEAHGTKTELRWRD